MGKMPLTRRDKNFIWFGFFIGFIVGVVVFFFIISIYQDLNG